MAKKSHATNKPVTTDSGTKLEQNKNLIELDVQSSTHLSPTSLDLHGKSLVYI